MSARDQIEELAVVTGFKKAGDKGPVVEWRIGATVGIGTKLYADLDVDDARRYRFLRDHCNHVRNGVRIQFSSSISDADAAIDAMLAELDRGKGG